MAETDNPVRVARSWLDELPAALILGWTLSASISIAVSQIFVGLSFAAVVLRFLIRSPSLSSPPKSSIILITAISIWVISQLPSVLASPEPSVSWLGLGSSDWLLILALSLPWSGAREVWVIRWIVGLGVSASIAAVLGLWQHFSGWNSVVGDSLTRVGRFYRAEGFFDFPLTLAGVELAVFALVAALVMSGSVWRHQWHWRTFAVMTGLVLCATYARGAWIAAAVTLIVVATAAGKRRRSLALLAGVFALGLILMMVIPETAGRLSSVVDIKDSGRFELWGAAIRMFLSHPFTGIGIARFQTVFPQIYHGGAYIVSFCHAHSDPLNRLAETGAIGIMGAVVMWGTVGWMGWRLWRVPIPNRMTAMGRGAAIALFALWLAGWSQCYYTDAEVGAVWWFLVGVLGLSFKRVSTQKAPNPN